MNFNPNNTFFHPKGVSLNIGKNVSKTLDDIMTHFKLLISIQILGRRCLCLQPFGNKK